jgi:hypothetical protein
VQSKKLQQITNRVSVLAITRSPASSVSRGRSSDSTVGRSASFRFTGSASAVSTIWLVFA